MKTLVFITIILACKVNCEAQQSIIKWNFLPSVMRVTNLSFERMIKNRNGESKQSIHTTGFYWRLPKPDEDIEGFGFVVDYRFYSGKNKMPPSGFFVEPFVRYVRFEQDHAERVDAAASIGRTHPRWGNFNSVGVGFCLGYQWIFKPGFTIDTFAGLALDFRTRENWIGPSGFLAVDPAEIFNEAKPRGGVRIGWAF